MTNLKDQTDLTSAVKQFEIESNDKLETIIEKAIFDNGNCLLVDDSWLLIKFDSEKEPRWVHESRLSKITEH